MRKRGRTKRVLLFFLFIILVLFSVLAFNTFRFRSKQVQVEAGQQLNLDSASITRRLSESLRFKTVSKQEGGEVAKTEFQAFHEFLRQNFPKTHGTLTREVVSEWSLLYTWKGVNQTLKPILLSSHQDVVPAEGTEAAWQHPPFDGLIADGFIWGRGTMDDKSSMLGTLEAVETLLSENYQPQRTVYLAFGHDEEIGGKEGASKIASLLQSRGVRLEYVIDEGFFLTDGIVPGVTRPVALVGIAEKGFLSLELTVEGEGGHSSVPPPHTSIGILSQAINKLERQQMPPDMDGVVRQMFDYIGPEMPFGKKLVFANLWLFKPLVQRQLAASTSMNASTRTTTAVTIVEGGIKDNVLPTKARAVVNFRILPGNTVESVIDHVTTTIDDPRVKIARYGTEAFQPTPISDTSAQSFQFVQRSIKQVFGEVVVAPGLVVGATDARHYQPLTNAAFRFLPVRMRSEDIRRMHGVNERISVDNYLETVKFYYYLVKNSTS